jgi:hypothetical protein
MRSITVLTALLAALAFAACGNDGDGGDGDSGQAEPRPAAQRLPRGLAPPVALRKAYAVAGARKSVSSRAVPSSLLDPWRNPAVPVPEGSRLVAVQVTWLDRGRDRFPIEWARFSARDDRGARLAGDYVGPTRRSDRLTIVPVGFIIGRGRRLESLEMRSIATAVWPFRASWTLRG